MSNKNSRDYYIKLVTIILAILMVGGAASTALLMLFGK